MTQYEMHENKAEGYFEEIIKNLVRYQQEKIEAYLADGYKNVRPEAYKEITEIYRKYVENDSAHRAHNHTVLEQLMSVNIWTDAPAEEMEWF